MGVRHVGELLALPVRHNGIDLGRAVDVLLDLGARRALGLEVRCRDEVLRFLPLGAARHAVDAMEVGSPLALFDDVAFYRARGRSFRTLRGTAVSRGARGVGTLLDVAVGADGTLEALVVGTAAGRISLPYGQDVELAVERKASAA
jgi:hypothetical protein